jgi:hypothetical protein
MRVLMTNDLHAHSPSTKSSFGHSYGSHLAFASKRHEPHVERLVVERNQLPHQRRRFPLRR